MPSVPALLLLALKPPADVAVLGVEGVGGGVECKYVYVQICKYAYIYVYIYINILKYIYVQICKHVYRGRVLVGYSVLQHTATHCNTLQHTECWWGTVLIVDISNICMCVSSLCAWVCHVCVRVCTAVLASNYLQVLQCGRWAGWEGWG